MSADAFALLPVIKAGFPSPAMDYLEDDLDYNSYFKKNPSATIARRVQGDSMADAGIPHNSIVVIDRSVKPGNNAIVAVTLNGETLIKQMLRTKDGQWLLPANEKYKALKLEPEMEFSIWGTVTHCIIDFSQPKK